MPNDPSAGFIEVQGHYILHFAFFIALAAIIDFRGDSYCFNQVSNEWKQIGEVGKPTADVNIYNQTNEIGWNLMIMHLLICLFQLFGMYTPTKKISTDFHVTRKFFIFFSSPFYIFEIFRAQHSVHNDTIRYKTGSTLSEYTVDGFVCIPQKQGNLYYWLHFEIYAFYVNIVVLILYLIISRVEDSKT